MIAVNIGRSYLRTYNEANKSGLSAKEFFDQKYFPVFYGHPKYMQWVTNSPFVQMKKGQKPETLSPDERTEKLQNLHDKINLENYDASTAIGFPASEEKEFATTSGQVTGFALVPDKEDIYCSWIGSGMGIGVAGGLSIFFDKPEILTALSKGWQLYRDYLNDPAYEKLRGNQINTWNGQWLSHVFDEKNYHEDDPKINFNPFEVKKDGEIEIKTQAWVKVLFALSQRFQNETLIGYVYSLGQMNKTVGFVPIKLPEIRKPIHLYRKLFGENQFLNDAKKIESLFGSHYSFQKACQMGAIGVQALEPEGLREFIPHRSKDVKMPNYKKADQEKIISYNTYTIWLLAMLNNESLWDTAGKAAEEFIKYEEGAGKAKKDRLNNVQQVLDAAHRKIFISQLTELLNDSEEIAGFVELAKTVNSMQPDNFSYFLTLIRFRYAEKSRN
jgi:hypothetical protein